MRFVVIALAVGFPIAMLLSWVCELTPEGVVRTEDLPPAQARSAQRATGRIFDFIIIGALLLVIAMLIVGRRPFYRETGESISQKSIAVLPFENLSNEKENAYFADGVKPIGSYFTRPWEKRVFCRCYFVATFGSSP